MSDAPADAAIHARRLTAQLLAGRRSADPVAVAERLLAIQAQDPRGARLAIRARSTDVSAADVDRELTERRTLLITTLNRGTLHLVRSEDYPLLQSLTTPPLHTSSDTRLGQEGVSPAGAERAVALIVRWLTEDGPLPRSELRARLTSAGLRTEGQAFVHLIFKASIDGHIVRGPMIGSDHAFTLVRDWLPDLPAAPPRDQALAELARRYLSGHGPASDADLARWAGLPLRDARAGLSAIAGSLRNLGGGLVDLRSRPRAARLPPPRLLGPFEPVLLGWRSREAVLGPLQSTVVTGGVFRGFALAGGRAVAGWRLRGREVQITPATIPCMPCLSFPCMKIPSTVCGRWFMLDHTNERAVKAGADVAILSQLHCGAYAASYQPCVGNGCVPPKAYAHKIPLPERGE